jgi:hypothetical protein
VSVSVSVVPNIPKPHYWLLFEQFKSVAVFQEPDGTVQDHGFYQKQQSQHGDQDQSLQDMPDD